MTESRADLRELQEIRERIVRLRHWVESPAFRQFRGRGSRTKDALWEADTLRQRLLLLKLRQHDAKDDAISRKAALDWVRADDSETESDLLESIGRTIERRKRESAHGYVKRLRSIVARFRRQ